MDPALYEVKGHERKEITRTKVDCGDCVATSYYDPETNELLRRDINIEVSEEVMQKLRLLIQNQGREATV